jgi:hypothetical protein
MAQKSESRTTDVVKKGEISIVKRDEDTLKLGGVEMDLSGLTKEQIQDLKVKAGEAMIDVGKKAAQQKIDTNTLDEKLRTMTEHTDAVSKAGGSITITSTQDDSIGRTEILTGDSDAAKKGKLSRSQTGANDLTYVWIGLGVFFVIVIAIIALMK